MVIDKKIIFRRTILDIPLFLFFGSQIISTLLSIDPRTSWLGYYSRFNGGLASTISYLALYWAFVSNLDKKDTLLIVRNSLITAAIVAIYGILEHFGRSPSCFILTGYFNVDCWVQDVKTRVFATLGQPNWLAAYLVTLLPLAISNLQFTIYKNKKFWLLASIVIFVAILFTKSRSGLLGIAVAFAIFGLANLRSIKSFLVLIIGMILAVAIFGTPWTPSIPTLLSNSQKLTGASAPLPEEGGTESGDIRKIVWRGAIDIFKAYPVFGTGPETFAYAYYQFRPVEHNLVSEWDFLYNKAHNEYLNYLANSGGVGLATYSILITFAVYQIYKNKRFELLAGYASILVTNFFGFSVVVIQILFFLLPAIAVTYSVAEKNEDNKNLLDNLQKIKLLALSLLTLLLLYSVYSYWLADYEYAKAKAELEQGLVTEAIKHFGEASKISPNEAIYKSKLGLTYSNIAKYFANNKDPQKATASAEVSAVYIEEAKALSPRNFLVSQERATSYSQLVAADPDYIINTIQTLEELIPYAPTYPKIYYRLGVSYLLINEIELATTNIKKAIELKPDYGEALSALEKINKISP